MRRWIVTLLLLGLLSGCAAPQPLDLPQQGSGASSLRRTAVPPAAATEVADLAEATAVQPFRTAVAPEASATPAPTLAPTVPPTPTPAVVIVPESPGDGSSEARWRAQQLQRSVLSPPKIYESGGPTTLYWYDPETGQVLEIGSLRGSFPVQAEFVFRPTSVAALEVPYRINGDFGLTAISDALIERMRRAGYDQTVEAFVIASDTIRPRP